MNEKQQEMVIKNQRLVYYVVNKMGILHEYEDIVSIGTLGLVKAVLTFDETKGTAFATYASRCITNEILMHYRREKKQLEAISLEEPINTDSEGNGLSLANVIPDSEEDFTKKVEAEIIFINAINFILNALLPKETSVTLYLMAGFTKAEIAKKLNVSKSYISKLAKRAHSKVKEFLKSMQEFRGIFSMSVDDGVYKITFPSNEVKDPSQFFSSLRRKLGPQKEMINFRVCFNSEYTTIIIPAERNSFAFIAKVMQEIYNFRVSE